MRRTDRGDHRSRGTPGLEANHVAIEAKAIRNWTGRMEKDLAIPKPGHRAVLDGDQEGIGRGTWRLRRSDKYLVITGIG